MYIGLQIGQLHVFASLNNSQLKDYEASLISHNTRPEQNLIFRNLPEVSSAHEILGVPTVSARFGTAPFFWNWGMLAMTSLLPAVCLCISAKINFNTDLGI